MAARSIKVSLLVTLAVVLLLAAVLFLTHGILAPSGVNAGLAALHSAYRRDRRIAPRISGFAYSPCGSEAALSGSSVDRNRLEMAEETLLRESLERPNSVSLHALGQYYLAEDRFDEAITLFDKAQSYAPASAGLLSDLGAAWIEKGNATDQDQSGASLDAFGRALDLLDRAIELDGSPAEARFNRALCCQSMALFQSAAAGWRQYLQRDPNSGWGAEARARLKDLERKIAGFEYDHALAEHFAEAYLAGDKAAADALLRLNTESITGNLLWWQLLDRYLNSESLGSSEDAKLYLNALSYAGRLQAEKGDLYVESVARFYAASTPAQKLNLGWAHHLINDANSRCLVDDIADALDLYRTAQHIFVQNGSPEELLADYWIAYCEYVQANMVKALESFSRLSGYCRSRRYLWLAEQALFMESGMSSNLNKPSEAISRQNESLSAAQSIGDAYGLQKNLDQAAYEFKLLGNTSDSLTNVWFCLRSMKDYWTGDRQFCRNYDTAAQVMGALGYYSAAAECESSALGLALEKTNDPGFAGFCYMELASISEKRRLYPKALDYARLSYAGNQSISDQRTRLNAIARSEVSLGDAYRCLGDYAGALAHYTDAIKLFDELKIPAFVYNARKGRLLCYLAEGKDTQSEEELAAVLELFERYRAEIVDEHNRDSFFDLEEGAYDLAIDFEYSRKQDYNRALEYSEISRARSLLEMMTARSERPAAANSGKYIAIPAGSRPSTLADIAAGTPADCQIVQYSVLDDKLLIWVVTQSSVRVAEKSISSSDLSSRILSYCKSISSPEKSREDMRGPGIDLYGILFEPIESFLDKGKQIVIVPDKALNFLPFNALLSPRTGKYLVNDYLLTVSPSATVFLLGSRTARAMSGSASETVLSVGNPSFDKSKFPQLSDLPSSAREAEQVSRCYASALVLTGRSATKQALVDGIRNSAVVHIASHYLVDPDNPMRSELVTAASPGQGSSQSALDGLLRADEIYHLRMPLTKLVVLSACRTGMERYYKGEGMIGMSRTFLAAGVPMVVASLWQVASDPTADLMVDFHQRRTAGGMSTAAALRQAQLDMIGSSDFRFRQPYYWAPFVVIGGYASF
jgi:CHAT domain-containing protein